MNARAKATLLLLAVVAISMATLLAQGQKKTVIAFPKGYRHWTHVKSMVIFGNQHPLYNRIPGLHDVYVNDTGLPSLQQGKSYLDGSVLVFDLYDITSGRGAIETHNRKLLAVMKKNAKLYAETGGWGFEVFKGDEEKGSLDNAKQCFDCHASQKRVDYVYSTYSP